jgi:limonene-1,2-epoxide hydrolase/DNA-binding XRE family transcriptional regulator
MSPSDIVSCNGDMITRVRKSCELTQEALAELADLSVRVIRKAESGGDVRFSTLLHMASAFQQLGATVQAGDLCTDPVEVVRTFVEAYRTQEQNMVTHVRHLLREDLVTFVAGDPSMIPFAGVFHGPDGLTEFWTRFFSLVERYDKNALSLQYFVNGSEVVAYGTEKARIKGHTTDEPSWLCLKFDVSGGIITRFEDYFDTQSAQKYLQQFRDRLSEEEDN